MATEYQFEPYYFADYAAQNADFARCLTEFADENITLSEWSFSGSVYTRSDKTEVMVFQTSKDVGNDTVTYEIAEATLAAEAVGVYEYEIIMTNISSAKKYVILTGTFTLVEKYSDLIKQ